MKKRLGKGLDALFEDSSKGIEDNIENVQKDAGETIEEIEIDKIFPSEKQPRKIFDEDKIEELAQSIRSVGLIQPLIVRKEGEKFVLIAGERRLRACRLAGLKKVPCIVRDYSNTTEIALIENIQRKDLNPYEEALAYKKLIDQYGYTQDQLARKLGISRSKIANLLRILNIGENILQMIIEGKISEGHAKVLLSVEDENERENLARLVVDRNLSVRELEEIIKVKKEQEREKVQDEVLKELEENLMKIFGLRVKIYRKKKKGKVEIEFTSDEELEKIISILMP
ncbi:ParB/RepB/Spo0J family partition protein [Caldicellulosiruptor morganii]|uniref:ParB/RepB/Spo0J family partition protein n=1 Tax=Caldicellulosiruptor morganii TaxID=1387555 RepID=A0ABY7BN56_9FIRM|nr:ParB/RepB/Spo0J family partition protein [Caldicellulosiruptor morganii]WAM33853.1 ParB/RepB/Spo0J family partition protein [Caldicellulosiruptor morganii]